MSDCEIRRARAADAPALTRVAHASKRHWRYSEDLMLQWKDALTVTGSFVEKHPVYCAVDGGQCVGFYALAGDGEMLDLEHMWVIPERIGSGVGTRLFEHAFVTARAGGGRSLRIVADPYAEGFYVKMGALRVGDWPSTPEGRRLPMLQYDL